MSKRGVYLMVVVLAVAVYAGREREPEYGGKRLSEWVRDVPSRLEWGRKIDAPMIEHMRRAEEEARDALRHMGTSAVPYLSKWVKYEEPAWKKGLAKSWELLTRKIPAAGPFYDGLAYRADNAMDAFGALDVRSGRAAVPELAAVLNDPKALRSAERAAEVLRYCGQDALPALLTVMTNHEAGFLRLIAISSIRAMGTNARAATPILIQCLRDKDDLLVVNAAQVLYRLNDPDPMATNAAAIAVNRIDPKALEKIIADAEETRRRHD